MISKLIVFLEQKVEQMLEDISGEVRQRLRDRHPSDFELANIMRIVRALMTVIFQVLKGKTIDEKGFEATLAALGERQARQGYTLADMSGVFQVIKETIYRYLGENLKTFSDIHASQLIEFSTVFFRLFNRLETWAIGPFIQFQENIIEVQQSFLKHKFSNLFKVVEAISNNLNMQEFCGILLDYLCRFYDVKVAGVFLLDEKGKELYPHYVRGLSRRFQSEQRLSTSSSAIKQCLLAGSALAVNDTPFLSDDLTITFSSQEATSLAQKKPASKKPQPPSRPECVSLYAPMIGRQRTYGIVSLHSFKIKRYSQTEIQQFEILARIVAVALENARFYQNLIEEKGKLDAIVNSISDGLILIDFHEEIVFINEQASSYLQQPVYKSLGSPASIIIEKFIANAKDAHIVQATYQRSLNNIIDHPVMEFTSYKPEIADIRLSMFPVHDRDHHFIGRGLIIEDVSHEKEVNRMKSEFVAMASHTMRTPMTSILGFASLLVEKKIPAHAQDKYIHSIYRESMRLTNILNDLLELANIEAGKISLKLVPVEPQELLRSAVMESRVQFQREIEIRPLTQKIPRLIADRQKLHQAILNLIRNAAKYTENKITISVKKITKPHFRTGWHCSQVDLNLRGIFPAIAFCVEDMGKGIPPDQLNAIFEPFYRLNSHLHEGTGLGLTIIRYIVEAHGGKVWVETKPGKGSAFTFIIPLELTHPDQNLSHLAI